MTSWVIHSKNTDQKLNLLQTFIQELCLNKCILKILQAEKKMNLEPFEGLLNLHALLP